MHYLDSVLTTLETGAQVDAIYLDFSKAFDKVDHVILLKKVENVGIRGKTLDWIKEFLTNRKQQVRVGNHLSSKEWVRSGVPQGSVLGPLLFIIMMSDIDDDIIDSEVSSYADDTRIWRMVCDGADRLALQSDLNTLYNWARNNNATYNGEKFEGMTFPTGLSSGGSYVDPSGATIENKEIVKDLGVYVSNSCVFTEHIKIYVRETQKIAAWTLRTFLSRDKWVLKVLLQSLIVPKVEYASIIWCPFDPAHITMIESIQRRYTSQMEQYRRWDEQKRCFVSTLNYWERLKDLKLYSLERRRERFLILCVYRVMIGLMEYDGFEVYMERGIKIKTKYNRRAPPGVKKIRHSSFFYKGPQIYNILPSELRQLEEIEEPSQGHVDKFKHRLDKYLALIPDQPNVKELNSQRQATNNSLICQIPTFKKNNPDYNYRQLLLQDE